MLRQAACRLVRSQQQTTCLLGCRAFADAAVAKGEIGLICGAPEGILRRQVGCACMRRVCSLLVLLSLQHWMAAKGNSSTDPVGICCIAPTADFVTGLLPTAPGCMLLQCSCTGSTWGSCNRICARLHCPCCLLHPAAERQPPHKVSFWGRLPTTPSEHQQLEAGK